MMNADFKLSSDLGEMVGFASLAKADKAIFIFRCLNSEYEEVTIFEIGPEPKVHHRKTPPTPFGRYPRVSKPEPREDPIVGILRRRRLGKARLQGLSTEEKKMSHLESVFKSENLEDPERLKLALAWRAWKQSIRDNA